MRRYHGQAGDWTRLVGGVLRVLRHATMPGGFTRVHHVGENEAEELKRQMIALRPFEVTFDGPIGIRVLDGEPRAWSGRACRERATLAPG